MIGVNGNIDSFKPEFKDQVRIPHFTIDEVSTPVVVVDGSRSVNYSGDYAVGERHSARAEFDIGSKVLDRVEFFHVLGGSESGAQKSYDGDFAALGGVEGYEVSVVLCSIDGSKGEVTFITL